MRYFVLISFTCFSAALIQGCISKGSRINALEVPRFVPQSQPDSLRESGIRQDPNTGGIVIQWYTVSGADGYKLYRSDTTDQEGAPFEFKLVGNITSSKVLDDTSTVDISSILTGETYYYYLTAYASDGSSTLPSDTINYALLNRPGLYYPSPNASLALSALYFKWDDRTGGGYTVLRVTNLSEVPNVTIWVTKRFQVFESYPFRYFNFDSTATAPLISGSSYQWQVERFNIDGSGKPYQGATSPRGTFTIE